MKYIKREVIFLLSGCLFLTGFSDAEYRDIKMTLNPSDREPAAKKNLIPDSSFEYKGTGAWNRMIDQSYLPEKTWVPDHSTAFHGKRSLRSQGGASLVLQTEGNFSGGVFSIYLKSAAPYPKIKIEAYSYSMFKHVELASAEFETSGEWQRKVIKLNGKWLNFEQGAAPFFVRLTPLGKGTVWVDAVQLEEGKLSPFREYIPTLQIAKDAEKALKGRFSFPEFQTGQKENGSPLRDERKFTVHYPVKARSVPVNVAIPLATGEWFGKGELCVAGENGKEYPAQTTLLSSWPKDGSIRSVLVSFEGDLAEGLNRFMVKESASKIVPAESRQAPEIRFQAEDIAGNLYTAKEIILKTEREGKLFTTVLRRGIFCNSAGKSLAEYTLRTKTYHSDGTTVIDATLINPNEMPLVLQSASIQITGGKNDKSACYFQFYNPETKKFAEKPDGNCGFVFGRNGVLLCREASLRHPVKLELSSQGVFTGWLWPDSVKSLILSKKASLHQEFVYSPSGGVDIVARFGVRPIAMAEPDTFVRSGFFILPIGTLNDGLPFFKQFLSNYETCFSLSPKTVFQHPTQILHGIFNYGDLYGDGGWGNLESYMDFSEILYAVGSNDLNAFGRGLDRARHYRDVDVVDGFACYHSSNHTGGTRYDFSHSWPQGIILHYLLTGDPRSADVIRQIIQRYLERKTDDKYIQGSRSLGRYFLGLADFYALTGDPAIRKRFFDQLEYAEKNHLNKGDKDQTIFHWHGRLDPFQVWYGCCAFMEMYKVTGEPRLLDSFRREMAGTMNMDFFRHDLKELWPGLPVEETLPIQLGYHAHHRGALFYPLMLFYSEISKEPKYLHQARLAAYSEMLRGEYKVWPMDILRLAVLRDVSEKTLLREAILLRRNAASPILLNGDFSMNKNWFSHWHLPAGRQMSYDEIVTAWPLVEKKEFPKLIQEYRERENLVSPWRGYARNFAYLDPLEFGSAPPSLRITLSSEWNLGRSTSLESAPIQLHAGQWKISGLFRMEAGVNAQSYFYWNFTPEGRKTMGHRFQLNSLVGPVEWSLWKTESGLDHVSAVILPAAKTGWKKFEFRFQNKDDGIATVKFALQLNSDSKRTNIWFDDIKLERIEK